MAQSGILRDVLQAEYFEERGLIWVRLGPEWPGFNEALNDGVSSLSPRGTSPALSTYWIDHALGRMAAAPGSLVAGGNTTRIERTRDGVCARSDYELFDDEYMGAAEFVGVLQEWHQRVKSSQHARDPSRPEHASYQRNPF